MTRSRCRRSLTVWQAAQVRRFHKRNLVDQVPVEPADVQLAVAHALPASARARSPAIAPTGARRPRPIEYLQQHLMRQRSCRIAGLPMQEPVGLAHGPALRDRQPSNTRASGVRRGSTPGVASVAPVRRRETTRLHDGHNERPHAIARPRQILSTVRGAPT